MAKIKAGWAEVSITPDKRISLSGQFFERISEYVETEITVTALAIESNGEQVVFCSCDLVGVDDNLIKEVRERVSKKSSGIDSKKIILNATHTHTSHTYKGGVSTLSSAKDILNSFLPEDKKYVAKVETEIENYMKETEAFEFLAERISSAILLAWENRKEAKFACGFGRAAVGMCRRVSYDDGTTKMWGDSNSANFTALEGGNDSGIELIYFFDENEKLTGVVANIACPSQVVEHRSFISSDYWGKVKIFLREKFGDDLFVLGLCSPAGDQCPRDLIRWVNPETPIDDPNIERKTYIERTADPSMFDIKGTIKVGKRIANEIISVFEEIEKKEDSAELVHKVLKVNLPLRRVTKTQYEEAVAELKKYAAEAKGNVNFADNAMMHVHSGTVARFELQEKQNIKPIEMHVLKFGNVAFATNPFELFLDYGNQMRARSRARQTFLIQLCCGSDGYLPTKKAEEGGHYSAYVSSGTVGHEGGDMLVRTTLEEINSMF